MAFIRPIKILLRDAVGALLILLLIWYAATREHGGFSKRSLAPIDQLILREILVPRVPSTVGHRRVKQYLIGVFSELKWHVEIDHFVGETPLGPVEFSNLIFTKDMNAKNRIVLAAHYDTKILPFEGGLESEFTGATDSAVPCVMIVEIARFLNDFLQPKDTTLQLIFFDGEEAFKEWSPTDSLYGSRHLADKWRGEGKLSSISCFILLDLIGAPAPRFFSLFPNTFSLFAEFVEMEKKLRSLGRLKSLHRYFDARNMQQYQIDDDHKPFLDQGVKVLHLIPLPYPRVWHTMDDNFDIIDFDVVFDLRQILLHSIARMLGIEEANQFPL